MPVPPLNSEIELAQAVQAMRNAQNKYFSFRNQTNLLAAKQLESRVDELLKKYNLQNQNGGQQTTMFNS